MTTVLDIIKQHLIDNGHDGLFNGYWECCCKLDDLICCESTNISKCNPGYLGKPDDPDYDFTIYATKIEAEESLK